MCFRVIETSRGQTQNCANQPQIQEPSPVRDCEEKQGERLYKENHYRQKVDREEAIPYREKEKKESFDFRQNKVFNLHSQKKDIYAEDQKDCRNQENLVKKSSSQETGSTLQSYVGSG
ncbi:MAG: hypothetical protein KAV82_13660 [Phycisphaerae bacterium]|nr:hypothetical protein [Phycisphaerae bacterium]